MIPSDKIPKEYECKKVEDHWQKTWKDEDNYFKEDSSKPQFIIDTPPPYPTGNFHIGNALNWCYIDFVARYKRMRGYNVMFPQGWDCHGLPTEVKVEEITKITKNDIPREEFRRLCRDLTGQNIIQMRQTLRKMAFSIDWSHEYITMMPEYYRKTQLSFLRMLSSGYIYQSEHPVNYCSRCETAIAFAEVSHADRETDLTYCDFDGIEIATTRPELLAACVAVAIHPEDERYRVLGKRRLRVPLFGHEVPLIEDRAVDPSFGSGAVMICTFGDRQDVHWWKAHNLELRKAIDRKGRMTTLAGKYTGMSVSECRKSIIADLREQKKVTKQERMTQRVGLCWRCKTPIEILSEKQWFVKIRPKEILKAAHEISWYPEHMLQRMENWVEQMEWDWCISRQRIFATPIPVWFCRGCGEIHLPDERDLPIDPTLTQPDKPCKKCGSTDFVGEEDVLDTWMDSSISVLHVTGWNGEAPPPHFPAQIRPQGHDIIRTWTFYTILRSMALVGERPWEGILVNGMVLGEDGFKMSKSRGNIIVPEVILEKYGADALRQWGAMGAATGSDIIFTWNDVVSASRFQTKIWNITRFILGHLAQERSSHDEEITEVVDRWLMTNLSETVNLVTEAMERYQFDKALKTIRDFAWVTLADNYIEIVKGRLYSDTVGRASACTVLERALDAICTMMAPFTPYFAEECYSELRGTSVHKQPWVEMNYRDQSAQEEGDRIVQIVSAVRKYKHDTGLALNAPLGNLTIYAPKVIADGGDIGRALNARVQWKTERGELKQIVSDIVFNHAVIGPLFRNKVREFMDAIRALPHEELTQIPETIVIEGKSYRIPENAFSCLSTFVDDGREVDVVLVGETTVTIARSL